MFEALDLGARYFLCHTLLPHIDWVVQLWDVLSFAAQSEQIYFSEQSKELDDRIAFGFVLEKADFSGVHVGCGTPEVEQMLRLISIKSKSFWM